MVNADNLRVSFSLRGIDGLIDVSITRNTDPEAIGYKVLSYGEVHLDAEGKLDFPEVEVEPGVYRFEVDSSEASVYFGEASDLSSP